MIERCKQNVGKRSVSIQDVAELFKALSHERASWPDFGCFYGVNHSAIFSIMSES